ncbi:FAD dependent oxidoreductase [Auriscalpium vulgare]|uniref:FAD dependent oxidoreductase n=1 Tax=Auriscalpium vulgare TaxID=40419 RepID=A0ACB8RGA6_9AGAM|nr:FAD dependent oxidoreductase [Auriscalpium vulgare]
MVAQKQDKILIVGAGCFGISTAYHLLARGFTDVTVIDRSDILPAPDAASTDLNKVVRTSYSDPYYTQLARDAIAAWKDEEMWGDTYHESGVLVVGSRDETPYASKGYENDAAIGARIIDLPTTDAIRSVFPAGVKLGGFNEVSAYLNKDGGWAFAAQGVARMTAKVVEMGGRVEAGVNVTGLARKDGKTVGVVCRDGKTIDADVVVAAAGSWTASTFAELELGDRCLSTGQSIATIQLTPDEGARYREVPIILDFSSGFYMFPPNQDNIVKMAIHETGFTSYIVNTDGGKGISTPRTVTSHGSDGLLIPQSRAKMLRTKLGAVYPELAEKPFSGTRMCWYTDSPDGDWVIGYYPSDAGLVLATSGSGHAYKFLPVIGSVVADTIDGTLDPALVSKFAVNRESVKIDLSRAPAARQDLAGEVFCTPGDLLP